MDPISAIVGALVAGASVAATEVASKAVKDAYEGLKSYLATRFNLESPLKSAVPSARLSIPAICQGYPLTLPERE